MRNPNTFGMYEPENNERKTEEAEAERFVVRCPLCSSALKRDEHSDKYVCYCGYSVVN